MADNLQAYNAKDFIEDFRKVTGLRESVNEIITETVNKAVELIETNTEPLDDKFAEALRLTKSNQELAELVKENPEYYVLFISALMVVLDEKTSNMTFTTEQKTQLQTILSKITLFDQLQG